MMAVDFINSNIALFGTDLERRVKLTAAQSEEQWRSLKTKLNVWRVEKFHVKKWPEELYGQFHTGDSYIVLHTYGNSDSPQYDIHFWLGDETTIDEKGTAAYKTAELDTFLGGKPVQYRETQYSESRRFRLLFPTLVYLPGGVESGFHRVIEDDTRAPVMQPRIYTVRASDDDARRVYLLDTGDTVYEYVGKRASAIDSVKSKLLISSLTLYRGGAFTLVSDNNITSHQLYVYAKSLIM